MKKTLIVGLIAMMALVANAQDQKKSCCDSKNQTEKCEKKGCCKKDKKCDKKVCDKDAKSSDKAKKTDGQTGATKQEK